jgi:hypothetical protein
MRYKIKISGAIIFAGILFSMSSVPAFAQTTFETELQKKMDSLLAPVTVKDTREELLPNAVLQNLVAPSGWGGFGTYIYGGIGGAYPQVYTHGRADLIAFGGFCTGDPQKAVNIALGVNVSNVSSVKNFSANFAISRQIFKGSSVSAGGLQLFAGKQVSDAPGRTFYFAFSHSVQSLPSSVTEGSSKLTYTIGIGNGRFYLKSPDDIKAARGAHGTAIFGSISYEVKKNINFNTEWSGTNLACSFGIKPFESTLAIGVGVTDLTRYSSDKPSLAMVISYPLSVKR